MSTFLRRIQEDVYYRLLGDTDLANIAIILQRRALTESEVNQQLSTMAGRNGKVGICAIVGMPEVAVPDPNVPGPRTAVRIGVLVLEHPTINAGATGTGTDAENIAIGILQLLHHYMPHAVTQVLTGREDAIVPDLSIEGLVGYAVTLHTFLGLEKPAKAAMPTISRSGPGFPTTITLASATGGASIYYTTDGTYPSSGNPTATLYSAPFVLAATKEVRAVASATGYQQSDAARSNIT